MSERQMTASDLGLPRAAMIDLLDRKMDEYAMRAAIAVFLPLMTKPAKSPFEGIKYLPDMWSPNDG